MATKKQKPTKKREPQFEEVFYHKMNGERMDLKWILANLADVHCMCSTLSDVHHEKKPLFPLIQPKGSVCEIFAELSEWTAEIMKAVRVLESPYVSITRIRPPQKAKQVSQEHENRPPARVLRLCH